MLPPLTHLHAFPALGHTHVPKNTALTPLGPTLPKSYSFILSCSLNAETLSHAPFPNGTPLASVGLYFPAFPCL